MPPSFTAGVRDSLSNLAASLGAGRDKAANDGFVLCDIDRAQIEAMYRGDWLARKVVDIVPYDAVREWREWSGSRADVARVEAAERRLGLRQAVQRALTLGRLYGGGAIVIGTGETDPAALARPLDPETLPRGGLKFLHALSRWQLAAPAIERDPLSPWFGEATHYEVVAPERGSLRLHPSRVLRFLGNAWPDPTAGAGVWSDSVLLALYDAIHAVALTTAGATSLMHEAKVDVVTVPNLSEHLSSADTTAQLSARFGYAAAMKSINNLLLLGDGETWNRQRIDFAGLPEMVRTFLQVAAGAADIPVTRLLGQSPAGLSATGDSDTRNYYDMIAARQEIDLRPQLERLDRLIARSEGIDPGALTFAFRPLWQMDAATAATVALAKAQATAVYAGLNLWPADTTARLVAAQLAGDGTYPNAAAAFAEAGKAEAVIDFDPNQPRDPQGRWTAGGGAGAGSTPSDPGGTTPPAHTQGSLWQKTSLAAPGAMSSLLQALNPIGTAFAQEIDPEEDRLAPEPLVDPAAEARAERYAEAWKALREIDPHNRGLETLSAPGYVPSEEDIGRLEAAAKIALAAKADQGPPAERLPTSPPRTWQLGELIDPQHNLRISPPGLSFIVKGDSTTAVGNSYASQVRVALSGSPGPRSTTLASANPDGIISAKVAGRSVAIEAKYIEKWSESIYNPELLRSFPHRAVEQTVAQALTYGQAYPDGLEWITNSMEFVKAYAPRFRAAGVKNFHFTIIPATREVSR